MNNPVNKYMPEFRDSVYTPNGMKMIVETGHKTFDRQTNYIGKSNTISNTQLSMFIRAFNETECNGLTFPVGQLQAHDLKWFKNLHYCITKFFQNADKNKKFILHRFSHTYKPRSKYYRASYEYTRYVHGYIITDENNNHVKTFVIGDTQKSWSIIHAMKDYVCRGHYKAKLEKRKQEEKQNA